MKNNISLELFVSRFLKFGVIVSGLFILFGWAFSFKFSGNPFFNFESYDRIPFKDLVLFYFDKKDWFQLCSFVGLALLISIPYVRVVLMILLYLKSREFYLAFISIIVLTGLLIGLVLGLKL